MADFVHQHMRDEGSEALLVLRPVIEDRPAVEPDHVGQARNVADTLMRQADALEQAEQVKQQSANAGEEIKKQLQIASQQGQEIIARATKTSDEIRAKAQDLAKKDADALVQRAREAIAAERDSAIDELRSEFQKNASREKRAAR